MLITPRPGNDRTLVRTRLQEAGYQAGNLRRPEASAHERLLRYLEWVTNAATQLRSMVSDKDLDNLLFTRRYHALLASCGTLAGTAQQRLVSGLVDLELGERVQGFEAAVAALDSLTKRWSGDEWFVVADSSFYIHNPDRLAEADLHKIIDLHEDEDVRLLFPIAVVDELDGLKESGKHRSRWRAGHTLGLLDSALRGGTSGLLRPADRTGEPHTWRGQINAEIVLDQPGHVRLPIEDDEIIDRAVAIQALAGRDVRLLTCDTGQHTRGRAAGLKVTKVAAKDPGVEPDWEALDKPGTGVRAQRRAKHLAEEQAGDVAS